MNASLRILWLMLAAAAGLSLSGCIVVAHPHRDRPPPAVIIHAN